MLYKTFRFLRIGWLAVFNGLFWNIALAVRSEGAGCRRCGRKLARCLQRMGPVFIKVGQGFSTRPDLIGNEVAEELARLQDKVPPFNSKLAKKILKRELGGKIEDHFKSFDAEPVAAASVSQVHAAVDSEGRKVAVKILRPGIRKIFQTELDIIFDIAKFISLFFPDRKRFRLDAVHANIKANIERELNFRIEAAAASKFRENLAKDDEIYIPEVMWHLSSGDVLTCEWIAGTPLTDLAKVLKEHDGKELARELAITFLNQVMRDGFFHGDIHPGNIIVMEDGRLGLVDFGIFAQLDDKTRRFIAQILYGFTKRDYDYVAKIHMDAGYVPRHHSLEMFAIACRAIGEPITGMPVNKISIGQLFKQLFEISRQFDMVVQPQLLLLQKNMITLEGTGYAMYPEVNLWQLAEPWITQWYKENMTPLQEARWQLRSAFSLLDSIAHNLADEDCRKQAVIQEKVVQYSYTKNWTKAFGMLLSAIIIGFVLGRM
jgi:ubiquinone biosynthesis protein